MRLQIYDPFLSLVLRKLKAEPTGSFFKKNPSPRGIKVRQSASVIIGKRVP